MTRQELTTEKILILLAGAPERIAVIVNDVAPAQLESSPGPIEWAANDVLAHLRSCADVWGDCIASILADDAPRHQSQDVDRADRLHAAGVRSFVACVRHPAQGVAGRARIVDT